MFLFPWLSNMDKTRGVGFRVQGLPEPPKVDKIIAQKPLLIAQKTTILHTFGVQVGFRVSGSGPWV